MQVRTFMDIFKLAEKSMSMDEATWAKHANPHSVFTRFSCLPLIVLAIWSRSWLGWWCLVPLAMAILWTWLNPRFFKAPASTDNWASKGVLGERLFLNRAVEPIPSHHQTMAYILTGMSVVGVVFLAWGLAVLDPVVTLAGLLLTVIPKVWFVDRMVWLFEDIGRRSN